MRNNKHVIFTAGNKDKSRAIGLIAGGWFWLQYKNKLKEKATLYHKDRQALKAFLVEAKMPPAFIEGIQNGRVGAARLVVYHTELEGYDLQVLQGRAHNAGYELDM